MFFGSASIVRAEQRIKPAAVHFVAKKNFLNFPCENFTSVKVIYLFKLPFHAY